MKVVSILSTSVSPSLRVNPRNGRVITGMMILGAQAGYHSGDGGNLVEGIHTDFRGEIVDSGHPYTRG